MISQQEADNKICIISRARFMPARIKFAEIGLSINKQGGTLRGNNQVLKRKNLNSRM